ncbi:MAG: 2-hydroxyacyl-CoA dehydratase family protein [Anaerolineae bacterium]|nr:2-hydroxyacyl-CoA dehydratase family protein [Anaerolineae bacterium]
MARKYRKLATSKDLTRLMTRYYATRKIVGKVRPLAWVTSGAPVELLAGMGVETVYPENYGALVGAQRAAVPLAQIAEERGFSPDLCSYARCHFGSVLDPKNAPQGGLPKPDLLVACNNICGTVIKWYQALAQELNVPLFLLDAPYQHGAELADHAVDYVAAQLEDMAGWITSHTGRKLNERKFHRALELSNEAVTLWREIRELCQARPSPLNAPDLFLTMAPIVVLRGSKDAVGFYRKLKEEVEERVERGEGALLEERYRLLWDNIAIWYQLFRLFSLFTEVGACFVVDTYTNAWSVSVDTTDPILGLARTYATVYINQSLQARTDLVTDLVQRFEVDGMVFHSNRSCKPYSLGQYELLDQVSARTGVPGLVIEADMCDTRFYASEPTKNRIQAFLDLLEAS